MNKTKNIGKNINVAKIQEEKINIEEKIEDEGKKANQTVQKSEINLISERKSN